MFATSLRRCFGPLFFFHGVLLLCGIALVLAYHASFLAYIALVILLLSYRQGGILTFSLVPPSSPVVFCWLALLVVFLLGLFVHGTQGLISFIPGVKIAILGLSLFVAFYSVDQLPDFEKAPLVLMQGFIFISFALAVQIGSQFLFGMEEGFLSWAVRLIGQGVGLIPDHQTTLARVAFYKPHVAMLCLVMFALLGWASHADRIRMRTFFWVLSLGILLSLLASARTVAVAVLCGGTAFYGVSRRKKGLLVLLGWRAALTFFFIPLVAFINLVFLDFQNLGYHIPFQLVTLKQRVATWYFIVGKLAEKPLLGWGCGALSRWTNDVIEKITVRSFDPNDPTYDMTVRVLTHPHSNSFEIWLDMGLFGALSFSLLIFFAFQRLCKKDNPIERATYASIYVFILVMGLSSYSIQATWWNTWCAFVILLTSFLFRRPSDKFSASII